MEVLSIVYKNNLLTLKDVFYIMKLNKSCHKFFSVEFVKEFKRKYYEKYEINKHLYIDPTFTDYYFSGSSIISVLLNENYKESDVDVFTLSTDNIKILTDLKKSEIISFYPNMDKFKTDSYYKENKKIVDLVCLKQREDLKKYIGLFDMEVCANYFYKNILYINNPNNLFSNKTFIKKQNSSFIGINSSFIKTRIEKYCKRGFSVKYFNWELKEDIAHI